MLEHSFEYGETIRVQYEIEGEDSFRGIQAIHYQEENQSIFFKEITRLYADDSFLGDLIRLRGGCVELRDFWSDHNGEEYICGFIASWEGGSAVLLR